jgi:hypothetical protein
MPESTEMVRTQIYLTVTEQRRLKSLARATGRSVSDLIRSAIDRMLTHGASQDRLSLLRRARGIWKNRSDLPDFAEIRRESDRPIARGK